MKITNRYLIPREWWIKHLWRNSQNVNKLREKRGSGENYETTRQLNRNTYRDENPLELSQRLRFDNDMTFKRNVDLDDVDAYEKGYRISVIKIF